MTTPPGDYLGPAYSGDTVVVPLPHLGRGAQNGTDLSKHIPAGYVLDHVANGQMYLKAKSTQWRTAGPTVAESNRAAQQNHLDAQAKSSAASAANAADAAGGYAWLNGHRMRLVGHDAKGNPQYTLDGGSKKNTYTPPTAFDALDAPDGSEMFLMSNVGWRTDTTGTHAGGITDLLKMGSNQMTVADGVKWLANLSTRDPDTYASMVDKLHKAGYLTDDQAKQAGKRWSTDVGGAFAMAARDVAVVNTTPDGTGTDIYSFLNGKGAEVTAASAAAVKKVDRSYTDPNEIKASARNAAKAALGRELTPEEEDRLTGHFHSLESGTYDQMDAAQAAGTAATITQPSETGAVDQFVNEGDHEQEAANYRTSQYGGALRTLFGIGG